MRNVGSSRGRACGIALALCLGQPVHADPLDLGRAAAIADTVTAAAGDPAYRALLEREQRDIAAVVREEAGEAPKANIAKIHRSAKALRAAVAAASGFEFDVADNQQADIELLSGFKELPKAVLARNDAIVTAINHDATDAQKRHALFDADGVTRVYPLAEALGPKLGGAFLAAAEKHEIDQATALIGASLIGTEPAKDFFAYPRPFRIDGNTIRLVADRDVTGDGKPYVAVGYAFPSGHTTVGYTAALLLAAMLPERYLPLVSRAAGYGYSRVVLGVHYPLDVIGGRMIAERNVAHLLADPRYAKLLASARDELRGALAKECGEPLPACAKAGDAKADDAKTGDAKTGDPKSDPWAAADQRPFYEFTMTYGLARVGPADAPMRVPADAQALIAAVRPDLSPADRTALLARTAAPAGYPLDDANASWQRIDLYEAAAAAK